MPESLDSKAFTDTASNIDSDHFTQLKTLTLPENGMLNTATALITKKPGETVTPLFPESGKHHLLNSQVHDVFSEDPFIGKMVGNCKILEKINEGGTSLIYRAHNMSFNLDRVVKILKPIFADDQEYFERFKQEAQLTARLDHPNILRIFDTGEIGKQFFIEMEYVEGQSLRAYMGSNFKIREQEILSIAADLVNALEYAHSVEIKTPQGHLIQGILHRDIKPENIMLTPGKVVKLMDFGAAKPLSVNSRTMQGNIVGTPHYMSPEQINGQSLDARSDYFSLGVLLYELCSGKRPFESEHLAALMWKIDAGKYEPLHKLRPSISPLTEELIDQLLSRDVAHRPASAKEICATLRISLQTLNQWGNGAKVKVPFSLKRYYSLIALSLSSIALLLSIFNFFRGSSFLHHAPSYSQSHDHYAALLQKGVQAEIKKDITEAQSIYELIPAPEAGGDPDIYLESQLRLAVIYFKQKDQLTKARNLLEQLHRKYEDAAIEGYLGQLYFNMALYLEAQEKLEVSIKNQHPTVLKNSSYFNPNEFEKENRYFYANALDGQFTYIEQKPEILSLAINAWQSFIEFSSCTTDTEEKRCRFAEKRLGELKALVKHN